MDDYYVYILKCKDGSLYTGSTNNLNKRLASHNAGQGARYTRARLPVTMEYTEGPMARGDALRREAAIKKLSREQKLSLIDGEGGRSEMGDTKPSLERLGGWTTKEKTSGGAGTLYLVATPIGNLEDITLRALRVLQEVDLIAAEDTRHTRKLLTHFEITATLTSYHQHNRHSKGEHLMEMLEYGKNIALVTDAGMPGISDPGHDLVALAWERQVPVVVVPGASAGLVALIASGLDTTTFVFRGFLSQDNKERREQLKALERTTGTTVIYEAPHRLVKTLRELGPVLSERKIAVARELTKKFEEVLRGTAGQLEEFFREQGTKGEFVLVIQGTQPGSQELNEEWWARLSVVDHVTALVGQNFDKKEAIKEVAKSRNLPKREVYQMVIDAQ